MTQQPRIPRINISKGARGSRNIFINSSIVRNTYDKNGKHVKSVHTDEDGYNYDITGMPTHKEVKNEFNIEDADIQNLATGNKGKTTFNTHRTVYSDGAVDKQVRINNGTFMQANIGGTASFKNKDGALDISAKDSDEEEGNLEEMVKDILLKGVTLEQFLKALKENCKIKILHQEIKNKNKTEVQEFMDAYLS